MGTLRYVAPILTVLLLLAACRSDGEALPGRELDRESAPPFHLRDENGNPVSLEAIKGRPAVISFLYTDCPDVCPVIGQRIGQALQSLGKDAERVTFLAVSTDPDGDTPEKAAAFLARHGLTGANRHFLLGDADQLSPVWLAYGVGAVPIMTAQRQPGEPAQFGRVGHTDATYLIDREGRKRTLLRGDATAEDYARGLRLLLR